MNHKELDQTSITQYKRTNGTVNERQTESNAMTNVENAVDKPHFNLLFTELFCSDSDARENNAYNACRINNVLNNEKKREYISSYLSDWARVHCKMNMYAINNGWLCKRYMIITLL